MAMQTDVKSTHLNASGSIFGSRARVKGFVMCASASLYGVRDVDRYDSEISFVDASIGKLVKSFAPEECANYFRHAGYTK